MKPSLENNRGPAAAPPSVTSGHRHRLRPSLRQPGGPRVKRSLMKEWAHFHTCFFMRWISIWSTKQFRRVRYQLSSPGSSVLRLTCKVSRMRFSSSSSLISSLISLLEHIKAVSAGATRRTTEVGFTKSYLCWVFIWSNWSLRSLSSVRSCSTSAGVRPDGSLPARGSEVECVVGCKTADRALGNREEKECVGTLLGAVTSSLVSSEFSWGLKESGSSLWFPCCSSSIMTISCKRK